MKRKDFDVIAGMIEENSRVLDLGCANGSLLDKLVKEKNIIARGIEISEPLVHECIMKDLSVLQFDIDEGLEDYKDASFDYVILNQTLQDVRNPRLVIDDALRVGKKVIIGFPNFAYWSIRWNLALSGRIHNTPLFQYKWYDRVNIHLMTVKDFIEECKEHGIEIIDKYFMSRVPFLSDILPSVFAELAIYCIKKK